MFQTMPPSGKKAANDILDIEVLQRGHLLFEITQFVRSLTPCIFQNNVDMDQIFDMNLMRNLSFY